MAKNILICDDAAFMRMMIKDILTKNGYNVVGEAENGAKGIEKYNELHPDLVLMDITMPEMDGIAALKGIKQIDPNAHVFRNGSAGNGYRVHPGRSQGLYCKTVPGRPCTGSRKEGCGLMHIAITAIDKADSFAQLITVLIIFILVLAATLFTTRWIAGYQKGQNKGKNIEVVETYPIGNGKYIQIVRLAGTYAAIAVCKDTVTMLAEIPKEDIRFPEDTGGMTLHFKDLFQKAKDELPKEEVSSKEE